MVHVDEKSILRLVKINRKSISLITLKRVQDTMVGEVTTHHHSNAIIERKTLPKGSAFPPSFNLKVECNQITINLKILIAKRVVQSEGPLKEKFRFRASRARKVKSTKNRF